MPEATPTLETNHHYEVQLEVFSGPMELLLHLIEQGELDITMVSLAAVTDQYLRYVQSLTEPDPEHLAEFLVVAAKLLAIKAMVLIARPVQAEEDSNTEGDDLVRALQEYQLIQRAASQLKAWDEEQRRSYARMVPSAPVRVATLDGLQLGDLLSALRSALTAVPAEPELPSVAAPQYTIRDKIALIKDYVRSGTTVTFGELVRPAASALEVIVTFLAVLELLKVRQINVEQSTVFGEIVIRSMAGEC